MTCLMFCTGVVRGTPKRLYANGGQEVSTFFVIVKRNDGKNKFDFFKFEAWNETAKYINDYIHNGDVVSVVARPMQDIYKKKDGTKVQTYKFRVKEINRICHSDKIMLNRFGGIEHPELADLNYDDIL